MKTVSKKLLSLLLAVILLVSAVPFQAFAADTYTLKIKYLINGMEHSSQTVASYNVKANKIINLDKNGSYNSFDKSSFAASINGYSFKTFKDQNGIINNPTKYKMNGNKTVTINVKLAANDVVGKIVYDANGGKWDDGVTTKTQKYKAGQIVEKPTSPSRSGYTFKGWTKNGNTYKAQFGQPWLLNDTTVKLEANWERQEATVTVYGVKGSTLLKIGTYNGASPASKIISVLENKGAENDVKAKIPEGYGWDGAYYTTDSCDKEVSRTETIKNANRSVYVKFAHKKYTIKLDPQGGTVSPSKKTDVAYGATVTLPVPTCKNKVFRGWKYEPTGDIFKPDDGKVKMKVSFYPPQGSNTITLKAVWSDQATVLLHVYTNGNTDRCQFVLDVTNKVVNSKLSLSKNVKDALKDRLTSNGKSMEFIGLFDETSWDTYVATDKDTSSSAITVPKNKSTDLYVMVKNAKFLNIDWNGSNSNTANWDSSNPKTGDTAMIGTAFTVMVAAGAALAYVLIQRKKRTV